MRKTIAAGLMLAVLSSSACGVLDRGADRGPSTGEDYTVLGALAQLPPHEGDASYEVRTADLVSATEIVGATRPEEPEAQAYVDWIRPLTGLSDPGEEPPPLLVAPPEDLIRSSKVDEFDTIAGWSIIDVDSFAHMEGGADTFTAMTGDFDDSTLDHLPEVGDSGVRTVGQGEDHDTDLSKMSPVSLDGQPVRMAQDGDHLAMSGSTPAIRGWLEGRDTTLADDPTVAALARPLDDADVVSAVFKVGDDNHVFDLPISDDPRLLTGKLPEHAFDAVALGWAVEDGKSTMVAAYHFPSESAATESVAPLEEVYANAKNKDGVALSDLVTVDEITSEGRVVIASLNAADPKAPTTIFPSGDVPFVHD